MAADDRPNIVFVLAGNVGWGDWSCYAGSTPAPSLSRERVVKRRPWHDRAERGIDG